MFICCGTNMNLIMKSSRFLLLVDNFCRVSRLAGRRYKSGRPQNETTSNIITFDSMREEVYEELENKEKVCGIQWTRFPGLNRLLKGHRSSELSLLTGLTGCGKTTFLSEYSLDLCQSGVNTLWGSFEVKNVRLSKMMLCQFAGTKFHGGDLGDFNYFANQFSKLPMYYMNFHGSQDLKDVISTMSKSVSELNVKHVIIDNIQFMIGNSYHGNNKMSRFDYQDVVVGAFRQFATSQNCHITMVIHPRKEVGEELTNNSIFGGGKAIQEADNIMILQKKTNGQGFKSRKYIEVTKNRFDGDLGLVPLTFDKHTLSYRTKTGAFNNTDEPAFDITNEPSIDYAVTYGVDKNLVPN